MLSKSVGGIELFFASSDRNYYCDDEQARPGMVTVNPGAGAA
jgi:hypothetical protein